MNKKAYEVRILKADGSEKWANSFRTWAETDDQAISETRKDILTALTPETIQAIELVNGEVIVHTNIAW